MVGKAVLQRNGKKVVLHHLGLILLPVNMNVIEQVVQHKLQGRAGQGTGQKFIQARRRFIPLANIRSVMNLSLKTKAKV